MELLCSTQSEQWKHTLPLHFRKAKLRLWSSRDNDKSRPHQLLMKCSELCRAGWTMRGKLYPLPNSIPSDPGRAYLRKSTHCSWEEEEEEDGVRWIRFHMIDVHVCFLMNSIVILILKMAVVVIPLMLFFMCFIRNRSNFDFAITCGSELHDVTSIFCPTSSLNRVHFELLETLTKVVFLLFLFSFFSLVFWEVNVVYPVAIKENRWTYSTLTNHTRVL